MCHNIDMNMTQTGWFRFRYNDKERLGFVIGPDLRPNTNNVVCLTADGTRAFNVAKMTEVVNETELYA